MRRARLRYVRGQRTKTEQAFEAEMLLPRKLAAELLWFAYEAITLKLAPDCRYTPDYVALRADGELELWEVKPAWGGYEDSRIKVRMAAQTFPMFRFYFARRSGKGEPKWKVEEMNAG